MSARLGCPAGRCARCATVGRSRACDQVFLPSRRGSIACVSRAIGKMCTLLSLPRETRRRATRASCRREPVVVCGRCMAGSETVPGLQRSFWPPCQRTAYLRSDFNFDGRATQRATRFACRRQIGHQSRSWHAYLGALLERACGCCCRRVLAIEQRLDLSSGDARDRLQAACGMADATSLLAHVMSPTSSLP